MVVNRSAVAVYRIINHHPSPEVTGSERSRPGSPSSPPRGYHRVADMPSQHHLSGYSSLYKLITSASSASHHTSNWQPSHAACLTRLDPCRPDLSGSVYPETRHVHSPSPVLLTASTRSVVGLVWRCPARPGPPGSDSS